MTPRHLVLAFAFGTTAAAQQVQPMVQPRGTQATAAPDAAFAPATSLPPAVQSAGYRVGAEDTLQITVWKEATLSGPVTVRPDGMISLVLVGDVAAAGRTPEELGVALQERLKKYIQDPLVTVVVTAALSQRIYVTGEVTHVGQVPLTPNLSLIQAVAASGGLTAYANAGKMYILRTVDGKQTRINVDYRKALKGQGAPLPPLMAGDTIVVP